MSKFEDRLNKVLSEAVKPPASPTLIDINDQKQRKEALINCRGPHTGWDDYIDGKDYQPPMYYASDVPYGPKDNGKNPHSAKYGGVRPWSTGEILETLLWPHPQRYPSRHEDPEQLGILWTIARKPAVYRSYKAHRGSFGEADLEEAVSLGGMGALRAIESDQARKGVRFTSYIGTWIEEAMRTGSPPGYHNEYRDTRGLFGRLEDLGKAAQRAVASGQDITQYAERLDAELAGIDPKPGPNNKSRIFVLDQKAKQDKQKETSLGYLVPSILRVGDALKSAIRSGNEAQIASALQVLQQEYDRISEQEDQYTTMGPKMGTVITKPKDEKNVPVSSLTITSKKSGEEMERPGLPATKPQDRLRDPRFNEMIERAMSIMSTGQGSGASWNAVQAIRVIDGLLAAASPEQQRQYSVRRQGKEFAVVDDQGSVVDTYETEEEALAAQEELQRPRALQTIKNAMRGTHELGEYTEEIRGSALELLRALNTGQGIEDAVQDLRDLRSVAEQDKEMGRQTVLTQPATPMEYRVLLRLFGVKNYPERGTMYDPEIDEEGRLSDWAKKGYPALSSNKDIAAEMGVSDVRLSAVRKRALAKLTEVVNKMSEGLEESNDSYLEFELLLEFRKILGLVVIEEIISDKSLLLS